MSTQTLEPPARSKRLLKKAVVRRSVADHSQFIRHTVQWTFIALNLWIGIEFYLWVRWFERGGVGWRFARPVGVEGWLPIAGLMNLKYFLSTGRVPRIHSAAMFLVIGFLLMSLLMKKAFCSWLCPIGTLSEYLWNFGRKLFGRNLRPPRWLDHPLRSLKYLLLGFIFYILVSMPAEALAGFMRSPYGIVVDVEMLNFFRTLTLTGIVVLAVLALVSMLVRNTWCRYLCPYGALMGLVSLFSPLKIRRDPDACIDCGKCARVCPSQLPVDKLAQIRSAECSACMACVAACSVEHGLQFAAPPFKSASVAQRWRGRAAGPHTVAFMLAFLLLGTVLVARATGHWRMHLPQSVYMHLVPNARRIGHPGMSGTGSNPDLR